MTSNPTNNGQLPGHSTNDHKPPSTGSAAPQSPFFLSQGGDGNVSKPRTFGPFLSHLRKPKDLKILIRCSLAVWIATVLMFINPVLANYGQATFFGPILLFIAPPSGIFFINVLGGLTAVLGMCAAWTWGVITMKAALATRSTAETNALLLRLAQQASAEARNPAQVSGQSNYAQVLIFNGFALDTRVVVTYLFMLGLFVYLLARLRVVAPKLILFQIFGTIITDLFLTIAPLLPTFSGTVPQVLVKPAATAVAISLIMSLLCFPESTSHAVLGGFEGILVPMEGFLKACMQSFEQHLIEFDAIKLEETKGAVLGAYKGAEASLGFLQLDTSIGRWNTDDISSLQQPLRRVMTMFLGLVQLQIGRTRSSKKTKSHDHMKEALHEKHDLNGEELPRHGHLQLMHSFHLHQRFAHDQEGDLWSQSMRTLADSSQGVLEAAGDSIQAILEAIHHVNTRRWIGRPSQAECQQLHEKHRQVLARLAREQRSFAESNTEHLLGHHLHLFNDQGRLRLVDDPLANPIRGLLLSLVFEERILSLSSSLQDMLERIVDVERRRTVTRLWFPTEIRHAVTWALGKAAVPGANTGTSDTFDAYQGDEAEDVSSKHSGKRVKSMDGEEHSAEHEFRLLRVHGEKTRSGFSKILVATATWLKNTEGLYALRMLVVTISLTLPAVLQHSAGFFYRERGLWALIMSQTGLLYFTADFMVGLTLRTAGTVLGGACGMVFWYIGAGTGPGNPYGLAAIMALGIVIFMYCRLFAPTWMLQGFMLGGASMYLTVGYSYDDTHIPSYGNPGIGYSVYWRRVLLVIIGFTAGAIVTFLPSPPSATRDVARSLARNSRTSKDLYALLLTTWNTPPKDLGSVVERTSLASAEMLGSLPPRIAMLKFEFSSSNLDPDTLSQVAKSCTLISTMLSQLFTYSMDLTPELKTRFSHMTCVNDPRLTGDVMAVISLIEQTLKTGDPLPAVLPTPLLERMLDYSNTARVEEAVSIQTIREAKFRKYTTALNAWVGILNAIDDLIIVLKGAVGEEHVVSTWESDIFQEVV